MPAITLGLQIGMGLIWDIDSPVQERNKYIIILEALIWDIIIQGLLQPVAAVFISCAVCPLLSLIIITC